MAPVEIEVIRSRRKTLQLEVQRGGRIVVRAPVWARESDIQRFVNEQQSWIEKNVHNMVEKEKQMAELTLLSPEEIQALAEEALKVIPERVRYFAPLVGVSYGRITIRNQRSKWGSCSGKGNLNFNCLLMLTPRSVLDYVVVHELCHRKEMNHSPRFWAEVEKILPDYKISRKWLKDHGEVIMRRMTG